MFTLDRYGQTPIYEQLIAQIELHILDGTLREQDALPSVRTLATTLGINPNTLQKAYAELERRGICRSVPGSGRYVTAEARQRLAGERREELDTLERIAASLAMAGIPLEEALRRVQAAYTATKTPQEEQL